LDRSFYRFVTNHACDRRTDRQTDRQTDGQTEISSQYRVCITCSAVKNYLSVCWNDAFRKKIGFKRCESVKELRML